MKHFKRGRIEIISPQEFYQKLGDMKAPYHLEKLLKEFFMLLFWTGRRPVELLELKRDDVRITMLKSKDGVWKQYLAIDVDTKKGGKPVEIFLVMDQIPGLKDFWERISGAPPDFQYFWLLQTKKGQEVTWKTRDGEKRSKFYEEKCKNVYYWSVKFFGVPPYFFRHNRFSTMKIDGASFDDIKTFKGAKTMSSVEPYISPDEETLRELGSRLKY